jgi:hypothetical protein
MAASACRQEQMDVKSESAISQAAGSTRPNDQVDVKSLPRSSALRGAPGDRR